jgi:hypothetical protein
MPNIYGLVSIYNYLVSSTNGNVQFKRILSYTVDRKNFYVPLLFLFIKRLTDSTATVDKRNNCIKEKFELARLIGDGDQQLGEQNRADNLHQTIELYGRMQSSARENRKQPMWNDTTS